MTIRTDFAQNSMKMKKCWKLYSRVFYIYIIGGILLICYSFTSLAGISSDLLLVQLHVAPLSPIAFTLIIDSLITAPLGFWLAYRGSCHQHDLAAMGALALNGANLALMIVLKRRHFFDVIPIAFYIFTVYSVVCIAFSAANIRANITYHCLEEQEGFPHFNERLHEQDDDRFQRNIMDKYEQKVRWLKKTSSDSMMNINTSGGTLEKYEHKAPPSNMDSL